jgi:hypothetical protein
MAKFDFNITILLIKIEILITTHKKIYVKQCTYYNVNYKNDYALINKSKYN